MSKAGRKRAQNRRRTANGRLSRPAAERRVKGNERTQAKQDIFGTHGADAIGRAFSLGLLGEGNEAKMLLDAARRHHASYWAAYEGGKVRCALNVDPGASSPGFETEAAIRREERFNADRAIVHRMGHSARRAFEQLVVDINPDCGPEWLDRLCMVRIENRNRTGDDKLRPAPADWKTLELAIAALKGLT